MNRALRPVRREVTVSSVTAKCVTVRYGEGITDVEYLMGINKPKVELKVGDRGYIIYRPVGSSALWHWE